MKVKLINFSSDLPCKVKDYEFTQLRDDESRLLKSSEIANKKIVGKGTFMDYFGCVDFDGLVLVRKKSGLHLIFRFKVKDGKRSYEAIDGFILPANPELYLMDDKVVLYSFDQTKTTPKNSHLNFEAKNLDKYAKCVKMGSGYNYYYAVVTPISKQGDKLSMHLDKDFQADIQKLWDDHGGEGKGIKVTNLTDGKCSKQTACIIDLTSQYVEHTIMKKSGDIQDPTSIDLHNHILPGVDDGSGSEYESIELAKDLENMGITQIVLTPHDNDDFYNPSLQDQKFPDLDKDTKEKLALANEHRITDDFINTAHIDRGLKKHPYGFIMLEFGQEEDRKDILKKVARLTALYQFCIIAHPERYKNLTVHDIEMIGSTGALNQCNYKSIDPKEDEDVVAKIKDLRDKDLIDLLSTDTHHAEHIDETKSHLDDFKNCHTFNLAFKV